MQKALFKLLDAVELGRESKCKEKNILEKKKKRKICKTIFYSLEEKKKSNKKVPDAEISMSSSLSGDTSPIKLINLPYNNLLQMWFMAH